MRKPLAIVLCLFTSPAFADTDTWGNAYPPQCAKASATDTPVLVVHRLQIQIEVDRCGVWLQRPDGNLILVLDSAHCPRADTLRHERCHETMWRLTGSPLWHAD